mgnify:CR=1 FL=1
MMDTRIIADLTTALMALYKAPDVDAAYLKEEIEYCLRLAWRTGVLDNVKDTSEQIRETIKRSES